MIVTCPSCSTGFKLDPNALGPKGRMVRCGMCRFQWRVKSPEAEAPPQEFAFSQPAFATASQQVIADEKPQLPPWRSAVLAVAAAMLIMLPVFTWKIVPWFQPTDGLQKNVLAVELESTPKTRILQQEGRSVLNINGVLVNRSEKPLPPPVLKAQAVNARGASVKEWTIPLQSSLIEPGQRLPFTFSTPLSEQGVEDIVFNLL